MFNSFSNLPELFICHVFPILVFEDRASSRQTVLYLPLEDVSNISTDKPVLVAIVEGAQVMAGLVLLTMYVHVNIMCFGYLKTWEQANLSVQQVSQRSLLPQ